MYLGHISEKLGGDTWENLLKSKVFLPIGMTSTQVLKQPEDLLKDNVAKPYIFKDSVFQDGTLDIYRYVWCINTIFINLTERFI
jgi:CubicO group peptidase (beta-lactamase class C family)